MSIDLTPDRLRRLALSAVAWERVDDGLGIYPAKTVYADGTEKLRTEWQEGWNKCHSAMSSSHCKIMSWLGSAVPHDLRTTVEDLLLADRLNLSVDTDNTDVSKCVSMWVDCSDLFAWGCADGQAIEFAELPVLLEFWRQSPDYGGLLWCAHKRGMRPQAAYYKHFPGNEWPLFDAAGPERTDPDGAGRSRMVPSP